MKRTNSFLGMLIGAIALLSTATGCELIAAPDRTLIQAGGAGGSGGATGGGGMMTTGGTGGTVCDPAACPPSDDPCKVAICDANNMCGFGNAENGIETPNQTAGDCKHEVCVDGVATIENDDDPLDDMIECTVDTCIDGTPTNDAAAAGATCETTKVCDGNKNCVECVDDTQCTTAPETLCDANQCVTPFCVDGMQNMGETDVDCGGPCKPCDTDQGCGADVDCFHGKCAMNGKCAAPTCSDGLKNNGTYLMDDGETDVDCGGPCGATCGPNKTCDVAGDCKGNECTGSTCVPNCADAVQNNAETDIDCGGGGALNCAACADGKKCADSDSNCTTNSYCDLAAMPDHLCAPKKANGAACGGMNQCTSGTCTDGVCCNMACGGLCEACTVAGSVGTCTAIPQGQDPANECAGTQVCNGAMKQCKKADGDTCAAGADCLSTNCIDGVCCNTTCTGTCKACNLAGTLGTCTNIASGQDPENECSGATACTGNAACTLADGAVCTVGAQCQSGNCVDGVCCNTACNSQCEACNIAGSMGTCGAHPAGADPDGECSGAATCNGNKACGDGPGGVACVPGAMNVCLGSANCPAGGICVVASGQLCIPNAAGACDDGMGGTVACPAGGTCP